MQLNRFVSRLYAKQSFIRNIQSNLWFPLL